MFENLATFVILGIVVVGLLGSLGLLLECVTSLRSISAAIFIGLLILVSLYAKLFYAS